MFSKPHQKAEWKGLFTGIIPRSGRRDAEEAVIGTLRVAAVARVKPPREGPLGCLLCGIKVEAIEICGSGPSLSF